MDNLMEKVVSLCKRKGFIFPGSEIYGGLANSWDYGPYGVQLKKNIENHWWKNFIERRENIVGIDSSLIMNKTIWEASGHVERFYDLMIDNKDSNKRYRLDKFLQQNAEDLNVDSLTPTEQYQELINRKIVCPESGTANWTDPKEFNLMLETYLGVIKEEENKSFLRPETAQGIFVNYKLIQQSTRQKLPFGIGQTGKAFRNEITPGNFIFRTREFEQMEIEYFIDGRDEKEVDSIYQYWKKESFHWYQELGINKENLRFRDHEDEELSHYSTMTVDIEYKFPFGWGELAGIAYRGNYDLTQHQENSKKNLEYQDPYTNEKYIPHVIEPTWGLNRTLLTCLIDAYHEETVNEETRVVLKLSPKIAPVKIAILPLMKKDGLNDLAREVFKNLSEKYNCEYDESGAIGKRYRRQDEIGTPYCITIDYDSKEDKTVTIRERDSMKQYRMKIEELTSFFEDKF